MRILLHRAGSVLCVLVVAASIASCGSGSKSTTPMATTTTSASTTTTTTLAKGETSSLAEFTKRLPAGYDYVEAPQAVVDEMLAALRKEPQAAAAISGASAHSVVRKSDQQSIAVVMLVEINPQYAALPGFRDAMLAAMAPNGSQVTVGGTTWTKSSTNPTMYTAIFGNIVVVVLGDNEAAIREFLSGVKTA